MSNWSCVPKGRTWILSTLLNSGVNHCIIKKYLGTHLPAPQMSWFCTFCTWFLAALKQGNTIKLLAYQFFKKFIYFIIFFWLRWFFVVACGLFSSCGERGYSSLRCAGFSLWWPLLLWSTGSLKYVQNMFSIFSTLKLTTSVTVTLWAR